MFIISCVPLDSNDPALFDFGDGTAIQAAAEAEPPDPDEMRELYTSTEGIDVDLTVLNSVMTYSQVFDMITNTEAYKGKVVKMDGMYVCKFELDDTYAYPDDYPEYEDTITVIGTFDTYTEDGYEYCTLRNAQLLECNP